MLDKIYIARHGFRLNWVNNNWVAPTGLARDAPLAAYGETQADQLAKYFLSLPEEDRPTLIASSPYYRCLQTAAPTSRALATPIFVESGLSECLIQYFPDVIDAAAWPESLYLPPRVGEDVAELHQRAKTFLDVFIPTVERAFPEHKRILLVSHAATVIVLTRALLGEPDLPIRVGCCSVTEIVRKPGGAALGGWEAKKLADGAHLPEGASREWGIEDIEVAQGRVVEDPGVPGTENEEDGPNGVQIPLSSNL
ncbi:hypothetical protein MKEN_00812900 [Mycena kentingensis (nom. inval.)]|nr:hypothetical protein MKEN_00812900 [Mycena kentingensis (nom. inval.)]